MITNFDIRIFAITFALLINQAFCGPCSDARDPGCCLQVVTFVESSTGKTVNKPLSYDPQSNQCAWPQGYPGADSYPSYSSIVPSVTGTNTAVSQTMTVITVTLSQTSSPTISPTSSSTSNVATSTSLTTTTTSSINAITTTTVSPSPATTTLTLTVTGTLTPAGANNNGALRRSANLGAMNSSSPAMFPGLVSSCLALVLGGIIMLAL